MFHLSNCLLSNTRPETLRGFGFRSLHNGVPRPTNLRHLPDPSRLCGGGNGQTRE